MIDDVNVINTWLCVRSVGPEASREFGNGSFLLTEVLRFGPESQIKQSLRKVS